MIFLALIYLAFISLGLPDSLLGSSWLIMNRDFGAPVGNAGYVFAIVSAGTIVSSLFSHSVIGRFGTGRVTVVSVAMTAIALLGHWMAPSFFWLMMCAIPLGLGAGAVDSGLNAFVAEHYKARHMNWLHCFWGVGAMLGPLIMASITGSGHSWRSGYLTVSIVQFVLVALLIFSLPMWRRLEQPHHETERNRAEPKRGVLSVLRTKGAAFAMLLFFLYTSVESCLILWGASYLVKVRGVLPENAAGLVALFFVGITGGRALSGFVSMKLSNEMLIRIGAILVMAGLLIMMLPLPVPLAVFALMVVGLGLAPIYPSMLHQTPVYFGTQNAKATMGLQMACAYSGTTLIPPLLGQVFSHTSFALMPYALLVCGAILLVCSLRLSALVRE